ncbi:unnamed protein product [Cyprideis torosa]|uniref:Uncharacterized protein n=1 Tax=Cyprideis torosa TaxID=163714 RepID=A0A7R8ZSB7_9CRUS|nr:unnamed protein product [Cyprideis torosa]CAG0895177.1 unnamed protein product [Cyprideis torosa]
MFVTFGVTSTVWLYEVEEGEALDLDALTEEIMACGDTSVSDEDDLAATASPPKKKPVSPLRTKLEFRSETFKVDKRSHPTDVRGKASKQLPLQAITQNFAPPLSSTPKRFSRKVDQSCPAPADLLEKAFKVDKRSHSTDVRGKGSKQLPLQAITQNFAPPLSSTPKRSSRKDDQRCPAPADLLEKAWLCIRKGDPPVTLPENGVAAACSLSHGSVRTKLSNWIKNVEKALKATHFDSNHPSMWRLLSGLLKEEGLQQALVQQMTAGYAPPPQEKYRDLNARLRRNIKRLQNKEMSTMEFLRGMSHSHNLAF